MEKPIIFETENPNIIAMATLRSHGNMRVTGGSDSRKNRKLFMSLHQPADTQLVITKVVHGDDIVVVSRNEPKVSWIADGLITLEEGIMVAVMFADCYPVLFYTDKIVGAIHSGYKGTLQKIAVKAKDRFLELGAKTEEIHAIIGPGICVECYEFGPEAEELFADYPEHVISPKNNGGKKQLDLEGIIFDQLINEAGLQEKNVLQMSCCTACNKKFFSYRKDRKIPIDTGMIGIMRRKKS